MCFTCCNSFKELWMYSHYGGWRIVFNQPDIIDVTLLIQVRNTLLISLIIQFSLNFYKLSILLCFITNT